MEGTNSKKVVHGKKRKKQSGIKTTGAMISPGPDEIAFHAKCTTHSQKNEEKKLRDYQWQRLQSTQQHQINNLNEVFN